MRIQTKPVLIFTEEEFMALFKASMVLQDIFNEGLDDAVNKALDEPDNYLSTLHEMLENLVEYAGFHRMEQ